MGRIKTLDLDTAVARIKEVCATRKKPFFFVVGAGTSSPPVKLAWEIEKHCMNRARRLGRKDLPPDGRMMDRYSHWFEQAYPDPYERQKFLRGLITNQYISHASLRLAHLLLSETQRARKTLIGNLVFTPNFDDFVSRALTLFGVQHIVYDNPEAAWRIDPERDEIQIAQVHGSYKFYDCRNLKDEIISASEGSTTQLSRIAQRVRDLMPWRSPLVVGYSGWDGDVIMTALKAALEKPLQHNLYWFCYRRTNIASLPDWLTMHDNVYLVIPTSSGFLGGPTP